MRSPRFLAALFDTFFGGPHFHPHTIRDVYDLELRQLRASDELRILQHRDVDVEELRTRMMQGTPPPRTMLEEVGPVWAHGGAQGQRIGPVRKAS